MLPRTECGHHSFGLTPPRPAQLLAWAVRLRREAGWSRMARRGLPLRIRSFECSAPRGTRRLGRLHRHRRSRSCRRACPSGLRVRRGAGLDHGPREHGHAGSAARGRWVPALPPTRSRRVVRPTFGDLLGTEPRRAARGEEGQGLFERRGRDSNPRYLVGTHALQACPFGRSGTSPTRQPSQMPTGGARGRGTLRVVECARGPQCGSRSRRHGWHTTLATSARSAAAPPAATRRRQPSLRPASADRRRPRGEPPRRHP